MAALNAAWTAASEDIYKSQGDGAAGAQQPGANGSGGQQTADAGAGADNVTDVPYEEVK
jgi:molecular chaperone DnaK